MLHDEYHKLPACIASLLEQLSLKLSCSYVLKMKLSCRDRYNVVLIQVIVFNYCRVSNITTYTK